METENKKNCCEGCKSGQVGGNPACKAKLMLEKIKKAAPTPTENKEQL